VALSLKTVGGFSVTEIARAFLSSEATIAQRLVRAKRLVREQQIDIALPRGSDLTDRLDSVLEVIYLLFNEGYSAHAGDELIRLDVCREALRLGVLVAESPEVSSPAAHALAALMAFQAARLPARQDEAGEIVLLEDQNRSIWDRSLVARGFAHFERSAEGPRMTAYHLQAAIAAIHAGAREPEQTRWRDILAHYDDLMTLQPSPIVALNRAVAVAMRDGPAAGLALLDGLAGEPRVAGYHPYHTARADLLDRLGRRDEAATAYRTALDLAGTEPERAYLRRRLAAAESEVDR
jgi:RNA polymerase sigma-70 factor (ECF subfamily)